jgi:hypothetical protein
MKIKFLFISFLLFVPLALNGCMERFDPADLVNSNDPGNISGATVYVSLSPNWEGFNKPQAILIGKEPFIYVADTENNRLVMLNLNGEILGTRDVKRPVAISQDFKMNLIVAAELDTLVNGVTRTFSALFKYNLSASGHQIENAPVTRLLPRPADFNRPERRYTAITTFYDNSFYVARTGPNNSSFIDPDNSILVFHPRSMYGKGDGDTLIGRLPNIDPLSAGLITGNHITSMSSFNRRSIDMVVTIGGQNAFKAQWWTYIISAIDEKYSSRFSPSDGVDFIKPNRFVRAEGSAVDQTGNIFIADAGKDSIFSFNSFGDELTSFGGSDLFNEPYDVAFHNQTLYVLDTGNNRIVRFILSTDQR